jgi:hypothetical protein
VRLTVATYFPFVELKKKRGSGGSSDYWLALRTHDDGNLHLRLDKKAPSRHYAKFVPDEASLTIRSSRVRSDGANEDRLIFTSADSEIYEWLADVDRMKAQKAAAEISAALARVGLDEYEWLRRGAQAVS